MIITNLATQSIFKRRTNTNIASVWYGLYLTQNTRRYVWFVRQDWTALNSATCQKKMRTSCTVFGQVWMCVCHARSVKLLLSAVNFLILLCNYLNSTSNITLSIGTKLTSRNTNLQLNYHHRPHDAIHFSLHFTVNNMNCAHNKTHDHFFPLYQL
jgi:hypothetical protein